MRLVSTRADLVHSWVTDAAGLGNADFEWHDFAKIWQKPGEGEAFYEESLAQSPEERGSLYEALFGVPLDAAVDLNRRIDQTMVDCILALYRSAVTVGKEWAPAFRDIAVPGRVLIPSDDTFLDAAIAPRRREEHRRVGRRARRSRPLVDAAGSGSVARQPFGSSGRRSTDAPVRGPRSRRPTESAPAATRSRLRSP